MERIAVASSNIDEVGYDHVKQVLEISFKTGGVYQYSKVPLSIHEGLMAAPSLGRYFNLFIKNAFPTTRLKA